MKGVCWEEVRNEAKEADFENYLLRHTRNSEASQEMYKGIKCPKKKGVKEEKVFKQGSDRIRSGFWKDDAGSI